MPLPRGLLLSAVLWVAACFLVTIGTQAPIQPTTGAYTPVVRTMIALLAVGACIGWPVARFGSARGAWGPARALLDTLTVLTVFHAVFWPLHLVTHWTMGQAIAMDLLLSGWIATAGACVALGLQGRHRAAWGIAWSAAMVGGAALDMAGVGAPIPQVVGPFVGLLHMADLGPAGADRDAWAIAAWPMILALLAWSAVLRRTRGAPRVAPEAPVR
jgi:hypothetical protein